MTPSKYQQAIYDFVAHGEGNAIVRAVAGSGKTTTLVESLKLTQGNGIFLAFNKSIAETLKARCPQNVQARTFHSLCYSPVLKAVGARVVNPDKLSNIIQLAMTEQEVKLYGSFVKRLVGLARNAGIGALTSDDGALFYALVEHHDLTLENEQASEAQAIELARDVLSRSNASREVDFDDLLYFAVLKGVRLPVFDWVFVDEAQDTNTIQRAILRKILAHGGRMVAVGDAAQAIYGFRGADSDALEFLAQEFAPCVDLPLSVTYRCAKIITQAAQKYVPEIEAAPGAAEGEVVDLGVNWELKNFGSKDIVVCRNTKPLIELGFRLLRARIPLHILGRDIGDGLCALIRKCDTRSGGIDKFVERLEKWRDREVEKAIGKKLEAKADAIEDKAATLLMLVEQLPENKRTTLELMSVIQTLFTDKNNSITLATVHKAKGLEADTVWWLAPSLCPSKWAKQPWQQQQERNLMYVAITRAAKRLVLIEPNKEKGEKS